MLFRSKLMVCSTLALLLAAFCVNSDAEARRLGGARIGKVNINAGRVARNVRPARIARRNVRRAGRWVNGVWVVNGVAASVAVGTGSNCGYYWRKWKSTGSAYWRERYAENCS